MSAVRKSLPTAILPTIAGGLVGLANTPEGLRVEWFAERDDVCPRATAVLAGWRIEKRDAGGWFLLPSEAAR